MPEKSYESDYDNLPKDMTPEANADVSRARLLIRELRAGHLHVIDGQVVLDEEKPADEKIQDSLEEPEQSVAGDQKHPTNHLPAAS